MRPVEPPRWTTEEFNEQRDRAQRIFCNQRLNESLEAYTETFEECLAYVNELLDVTGELLDLESSADGARDKSNRHDQASSAVKHFSASGKPT